MKRVAVLVAALAGCGDNLAPVGYDSAFDNDQLRVFGVVQVFTAPGVGDPAPGVEVCLDETCSTTEADGTFVATTDGNRESVFVVHAAPHRPTIAGVTAGPIGDRNLGLVPVVVDDALATAAAAYGHQASTDQGIILVVAQRFDTGTIELAVDGSTPSYLDAMLGADPTQTTMSASGGVWFFGVAPGEAVIRSVTGECAISLDGWPAAERGQIRLPIQAGAVTFVRPFCVGG